MLSPDLLAEARAELDAWVEAGNRHRPSGSRARLTATERIARIKAAPQKVFGGVHVPFGTVLDCGCRLVPGMKCSNRKCVPHYKRDWELLKRATLRGGAPPSWQRWTAPLLCGHADRPHRSYGCCYWCVGSGRWRQFEAEYRRVRAARDAEWRARIAQLERDSRRAEGATARGM